jgi:hypothetical protein
MEYVVLMLVCGVFYYGMRYLTQNRHISSIPLSDITDPGIQELAESMVSFLNEVYGVQSKPPRIKLANLSGEDIVYDPNEQPAAQYDYKLKMILLDPNYMRYLGNDIRTLSIYMSHEWKHYSDHLEGITYESVGWEVCEARANKFQKEGSRKILENLEL